MAWAEKHDRRSRFRAAPYQDAPSPPMTPELAVACERAVHVVTADGRLLRAGDACVFVLGELGWRRAEWLLSKPPFIWVIEFGYWIVARNRTFFSRFLTRS